MTNGKHSLEAIDCLQVIPNSSSFLSKFIIIHALTVVFFSWLEIGTENFIVYSCVHVRIYSALNT